MQFTHRNSLSLLVRELLAISQGVISDQLGSYLRLVRELFAIFWAQLPKTGYCWAPAIKLICIPIYALHTDSRTCTRMHTYHARTYAHSQTHTNARIQMQPRANACTSAQTHTHASKCTKLHAHARKLTHRPAKHMHTCADARTLAQMHAYARKYTHAYATHMRTHTHALS